MNVRHIVNAANAGNSAAFEIENVMSPMRIFLSLVNCCPCYSLS